MIEEMKDIAIEKFKKESLSFNKYYWKQDDKLENGIKTIYFRDKEMKKLEQNEYLKEVSNWGEIYRIIKNESR